MVPAFRRQRQEDQCELQCGEWLKLQRDLMSRAGARPAGEKRHPGEPSAQAEWEHRVPG